MGINEVINILYTEEFKLMFLNITKDESLADDLRQELAMIILTKDIDFLTGLIERKEFKFYCARILVNQFHSKRGDFHRMYKDYSQTDANVCTDDLIDFQPVEQDNKEEYKRQKTKLLKEIRIFFHFYKLQNPTFHYNERLFNLYFDNEKLTYREITKQTKIPSSSVSNTINQTKKLIKEFFGDRITDLNNNK